MKALSIRQPWAHFVVHGLHVHLAPPAQKDIENRRWNTAFRGEFLIHAAKGMTRQEYDDACDFAADELSVGRSLDALAGVFPQPLSLPRGAIIGRARLVDVIPPCSTCDGSHERVGCRHRRWHMPEQFGFVLEDVRAFTKPIPWVGALGFFNTPFDRNGAR